MPYCLKRVDTLIFGNFWIDQTSGQSRLISRVKLAAPVPRPSRAITARRMWTSALTIPASGLFCCCCCYCFDSDKITTWFRNGGECFNKLGDFECRCKAGFMGEFLISLEPQSFLRNYRNFEETWQINEKERKGLCYNGSSKINLSYSQSFSGRTCSIEGCSSLCNGGCVHHEGRGFACACANGTVVGDGCTPVVCARIYSSFLIPSFFIIPHPNGMEEDHSPWPEWRDNRKIMKSRNLLVSISLV